MKTLFLLACLLVLCSASRMPDVFDDPTGTESISGSAVEGWLQNKRSECNRRGSKCFEEPAYIMFKYLVTPDKKEEFEKAWLKLKDEMKEEKGIQEYALTKTTLDNVYYVSVAEWEDHYAFADHVEQDYTREFRETICDLGIEMRMFPLKKVTKHETRYELDDNRRRRRESERPARFLVKFVVPPQAHEEFLETWEEAQREVDKEKGIRTFTLKKVATDNVLYIGCSTWESWEDFHEHLESEHGCRLKEKLDKHRVIFTMVPQMVISGTM